MLGSEALPLGSAKTPFNLTDKPYPAINSPALARTNARFWPHVRALLTAALVDHGHGQVVEERCACTKGCAEVRRHNSPGT